MPEELLSSDSGEICAKLHFSKIFFVAFVKFVGVANHAFCVGKKFVEIK